jgi:hypothetical protein
MKLRSMWKLGLGMFAIAFVWASPSSAQISNGYPNDVGIRNHPSVIYATGFDSTSWLTTDLPTGTRLRYVGGSDLTDRPTWTSTEKFTGAGSLQYLQIAGGNKPNIMEIIGFAPVDEVYMRWYRKYQTGFRWGCQSVKNNGVYASADVNTLEACVQPTGYDKYSFRVQDQMRSSSSSDFYGALYSYHPDADNGGCGEWYSQNQNGIKYQQAGRWYAYEIYLKANTVGQKNGVIKMWVDGELRGQITGLEFRRTDTLKINKVSMYGATGGCDTPYTQYVWDDNLVLAREYIGPMATGPAPTPPAPPSNLRIMLLSPALSPPTSRDWITAPWQRTIPSLPSAGRRSGGPRQCSAS